MTDVEDLKQEIRMKMTKQTYSVKASGMGRFWSFEGRFGIAVLYAVHEFKIDVFCLGVVCFGLKMTRNIRKLTSVGSVGIINMSAYLFF